MEGSNDDHWQMRQEQKIEIENLDKFLSDKLNKVDNK